MIGISGIGIISAMGNSLEEFYKSYSEQINSVSDIERFDVSNIKIKQAALIKEFNPKEFIPKKKLRQYDIYSRLAIVTSKFAINSSGIDWSESEIENMGIVFSNETQADTVASYLEDLFTHGPEVASPRKFSRTAANTTGCQIAVELGMRGPSINIGSKFTGGFTCLYTAYQMIKAERAKEVLAGSADHLSLTMLEIYDKMNAFKANEDDANGASVAGEGAVTFILSEDKFNFGKILGISNLSSDVNPNKWPKSIERQIETLENAKGEHLVDYYFTSENGDQHIKELENSVINSIFKKKIPKIINLKKQIGEFSGAPMFQTLLALMMPKGTKSLISILGPGGIHGGILVESVGFMESNNA